MLLCMCHSHLAKANTQGTPPCMCVRVCVWRGGGARARHVRLRATHCALYDMIHLHCSATFHQSVSASSGRAGNHVQSAWPFASGDMNSCDRLVPSACTAVLCKRITTHSAACARLYRTLPCHTIPYHTIPYHAAYICGKVSNPRTKAGCLAPNTPTPGAASGLLSEIVAHIGKYYHRCAGGRAGERVGDTRGHQVQLPVCPLA